MRPKGTPKWAVTMTPAQEAKLRELRIEKIAASYPKETAA